jgi:hypothetical protein
MDVALLAAAEAQPVADVVAMLADKAKAMAAWSATTMVAATSMDKARAAPRTRRVAQLWATVARAHLTRNTTALTKAHHKSVWPRKANARKATLPTRASASTCNVMACTCSPAL